MDNFACCQASKGNTIREPNIQNISTPAPTSFYSSYAWDGYWALLTRKATCIFKFVKIN